MRRGAAVRPLALTGAALAVPATPQAVFARYVQTPAAQVQGLTVSGQAENRPTLRFTLPAPPRLPSDSRLVRRSYAEAYAATLNSPCRANLNGRSRLRLERLADPTLDAGRLLVQNGRAYCLTLWNIKR